MSRMQRKAKYADEAAIAERAKTLWSRWQRTGSEGVIALDNDELGELIMLVETALGVLRGIDGSGLFLTGLILTHQSLDAALVSRLRD